MAELADALDSGSSGHCARAGSSPVIRSIAEKTIEKIGGLFCLAHLCVEINPQFYWGKIKTLVYENLLVVK